MMIRAVAVGSLFALSGMLLGCNDVNGAASFGVTNVLVTPCNANQVAQCHASCDDAMDSACTDVGEKLACVCHYKNVQPRHAMLPDYESPAPGPLDTRFASSK